MSIEAHINIKASFSGDEKAKVGASTLRKSLKDNGHELASALDKINPIENQSEYSDATINVEEITRKKNELSIFAYTYSSEEPIWFAPSLYKLGANRIHITCVWDGHVRNYYFLNGKGVPRKEYVGEKPRKRLSEKDVEINKNLFLPKGRVHVKAKVTNHWQVGDIYESVLLEFETDDGNRFYHKTTGQLKQLSFEGPSNQCEFSAAFERGKLEGEYVSYAKRPSKVKIIEPSTKNLIDLSILDGTWRIVSNEGFPAEQEAYWIFQDKKFTQVRDKEKIGPIEYRLHDNYVHFIGDAIRIFKLIDNYMVAKWNWECELEKMDGNIDIPDTNEKQNFTLPI